MDGALDPAKVVMAMVATNRATAKKKSTNRLFERDFAHGFGAEDFADVEALHRSGAALIFGADDLHDDRIHLVAQIIERSPVWTFNQYENEAKINFATIRNLIY